MLGLSASRLVGLHNFDSMRVVVSVDGSWNGRRTHCPSRNLQVARKNAEVAADRQMKRPPPPRSTLVADGLPAAGSVDKKGALDRARI
jgi:hypothetical protein